MIDDLLLRGSDDWVTAAEVAWLAKSVGGATSDQEIEQVAFAAMSDVLRSGLMQVGDVTDGGFFEWDVSPDDALERVIREWRGLGRSPELGEVCWLANTPAGDLRAQIAAQQRRL
jgi:hypothetical protein